MARSEPKPVLVGLQRTEGNFDSVTNQHRHIDTAGRLVVAAGLLIAMLAAGCARSPGATAPAATPGADGGVRTSRLVENPGTSDDDLAEAEDYDPWQPFNEKMFWFNHDVLDRYLVRPAATGWSKVAPEPARRSLSRFFDNLDMPRRLVNNIFQARPIGAGRELARFVVNSTVGVGGFFDVASRLHIEPSNADAGETLGMYGFGPGPYLVLPTFPPATVRDAIGHGIDGALDPISYVLPFFANRAKSIVTAINERSLDLKLFADVEDSVLDLYSAARNGYLQRRRVLVQRALASREREWGWMLHDPTYMAQPSEAPVVALRDTKP
jgi:phospholipid-binding lipoprotein MlaA